MDLIFEKEFEKMKRTISIIVALLLALTLLVACGPKKTYTVMEFVDNSANQQRWLRSPLSTLVVNPEAIQSEETYTDADGKLGLGIGICDDNFNTTKSLKDVLFFLEAESSNGKTGEEYWAADFGENGNFKGYGELPFNESSDNYLSISTDDRGCEITSADRIPLDGVVHYFLVLELGSVNESSTSSEETSKEPAGVTLKYSLNNPSEFGDFSVSSRYQSAGGASMSGAAKLTAPGLYVYDLNRLMIDDDTTGVRNLRISLSFTKNTSFVINRMVVKTIEPGYSKGTAASQYTWRPYSITSTQEYKNGLSLTTEDVLSAANSVTRVVTCNAGGTVAMAGYLNDGTATFDSEKMIITIAGSGFEYSIFSQRPGTIMYCDSEEDLFGSNFHSEQTAESKYWILTMAPIQASETWLIGVGCTSTAGTTASLAREASNSAKYRQIIATVETTWNDFINTNKDIGQYIASLAK